MCVRLPRKRDAKDTGAKGAEHCPPLEVESERQEEPPEPRRIHCELDRVETVVKAGGGLMTRTLQDRAERRDPGAWCLRRLGHATRSASQGRRLQRQEETGRKDREDGGGRVDNTAPGGGADAFHGDAPLPRAV